jgi:hypothetical protein
MIGRKGGEQQDGGSADAGAAAAGADEQHQDVDVCEDSQPVALIPGGAARERPGRQRYRKQAEGGDSPALLSFRPSQVGVHSIAARRREHQVAAEWDETRSAWERQMANLRDSINDEREASASTEHIRSSGVAEATVNAFLAETDVLENMHIGRPASYMAPSRSEAAAGVGRSTGVPDISPLSARSEAARSGADGQPAIDDDVDVLMDAILLEAG